MGKRNKDMNEYNCTKCGGFVGEPMKTYGYTGQWCHCIVPTRTKQSEIITSNTNINMKYCPCCGQKLLTYPTTS